MPRIYAYIRVSDERQTQSQLGIKAQMASTQRDGELLSKSPLHGKPQWGNEHWPEHAPPGYFVDESISAWKHNLFSRPAFSRLLACAERGDIVLVSRLDRMFRRVADFAGALERLMERGINLRFTDQQLDFTSANGRAMAQIVAVFAEWESSMKGERIRAAIAAKREREKLNPPSKRPVPKWKKIKRARMAFVRTPLPKPKHWAAITAADSGTVIPAPVGTAYGYLRVSHDDSAASGLSPEAQAQAVETFYRYLKTQPQYARLKWGGMVYDESISAFKQPFVCRPEGAKLNAKLQPGDQVIIARMDRGFRNLRDFGATLDNWKGRGIGLHLCDMVLSMDSPTGQAMAGMLAVFAQWEAAVTSERTKAVMRRLRAEGRKVNGRLPKALKMVRTWRFGKRIRRLYIADFFARVVIRYVVLMRHTRKGMTYREIGNRIEDMLAKREGRKPILESGETRRGKPVTRMYSQQWLSTKYQEATWFLKFERPVRPREKCRTEGCPNLRKSHKWANYCAECIQKTKDAKRARRIAKGNLAVERHFARLEADKRRRLA